MTKEKELSDPKSCFNKAALTERLFVLLERDVAMAGTLRFWCWKRAGLGKNKWNDPQIVEALELALQIDKSHGASGVVNIASS